MSAHGGHRTPLTRADLESAVRVYRDQGRNVAHAAGILGISRAGMLARLKRACADGLLDQADLHPPNLARPDSRRGRKLSRQQAAGRPAKVESPAPAQAAPAPVAESREVEGGRLDTRPLGRDEAEVCFSSRRIVSLDELLAIARVDQAVWFVESFKCGKWDAYAKDEKKDLKWVRGRMSGTVQCEGKLTIEPLFRIVATLKRRVPADIEAGVARLAQRMAGYRPRRVPPVALAPAGGYMLEVGLVDAHLSKLCWGPETGTDYDLKIAARIYDRAFHDLAARAVPEGVELVELPVGSDFFHVNDPKALTPQSGHVLDMDSRLAKVFEAGVAMCIRATDTFLAAGVPLVRWRWVPGNHDPETSYFLARVLAAHFRNDRRVDVDTAPTSRKYVRWGRSLIGWTHGSEEKHQTLPLLMASERPVDWAETAFREWHVGHVHRAREERFLAADTFGPVVVRTLESLTGTDAWHYSKGYVLTPRVLTAFLWHREQGLMATLHHNHFEESKAA